MNQNTKNALQSKTVWGAAIAVIAQITMLAGWDIGDTNGLAEQITALIGGLIAIYGRITAVHKIG